MTQRESRLSRKIQEALRAQGIFCFKVHGSANMMAGLPDIIACVGGYFVGLEVKHPETRSDVSERQKFVHSQIRRSSGHVFVVCSVQEALDAVSSFRAGA